MRESGCMWYIHIRHCLDLVLYNIITMHMYAHCAYNVHVYMYLYKKVLAIHSVHV